MVFINTRVWFIVPFVVKVLREGAVEEEEADAYSFLPDFFGSNTAWMLGRTPPSAMVTPDKSLLSSSSLRTAS